jgi:hypothetical protein
MGTGNVPQDRISIKGTGEGEFIIYLVYSFKGKSPVIIISTSKIRLCYFPIRGKSEISQVEIETEFKGV